MAVQKFRKSKSKTMMRRRANDKRSFDTLSLCSECGQKRKPHHVCHHCGMYKGKTIIKKD